MATPQRIFSIVLLTTLTLLVAACGGESNPTPIVICEGPDCEDAGDQTDTEEPDAGDETDTGAPGLLCTDTCGSAGDGECDDGGPNSLYDVCALGTDCSDCGPRDPDATCTPDCTGRSCGDDGCGGTCGPGCAADESCTVAGQCIDDTCVAECGSRTCGADPVCGLSCGTCDANESCSAAGSCECAPQCDGRVCGDDGCGGTCGSGCTGSESCNDAGQCELGMRSWSGATANLRLILGDALGATAGRKVCIYGTDDDRPYLVLNKLGLSSGQVVTVNADYVDAPAGVSLRVSHHFTLGLGDDTPEDCDASQATPLGSGALAANDFYSVVVRTYDEFLNYPCAANSSVDFCEFYTRANTSLPEVPCATQQPVLMKDGSRLNGSGYSGGVRIANFTTNASAISSSFSDSSSSPRGNLSGGSNVGINYEVPAESNRLRICPQYLTCDPRIDDVDYLLANLACTNDGDSDWMLAEATNSRFSAPDKNTTVYVFGNAGLLNQAQTGIQSNDVFLVVAHDVSDGPLP